MPGRVQGGLYSGAAPDRVIGTAANPAIVNTPRPQVFEKHSAVLNEPVNLVEPVYLEAP